MQEEHLDYRRKRRNSAAAKTAGNKRQSIQNSDEELASNEDISSAEEFSSGDFDKKSKLLDENDELLRRVEEEVEVEEDETNFPSIGDERKFSK